MPWNIYMYTLRGSLAVLTHLCSRVPPEIVVWIYDILDNNLGIQNYFTEYLMESCW